MRFYLDTSVFGGFYDPEFSVDTEQLFEQITQLKVKIIRSSLLDEELQNAPRRVKEVLKKIPTSQIEYVRVDQEVNILASAYVQEGALTKSYISDAQHIAMATTRNANTLVSWNFRHMVNFFRVQQYNSINLKRGYKTIDIRSPKEVLL